jgi:glucosamine 6-phosphate synthetase-like amidotransferase/phosphosugar isomerase protein
MKHEGDHMIITCAKGGVGVAIKGDMVSQLTMLASAAISIQQNFEMSDAEFMSLMLATFKITKDNLDKSITIDEGQIKDIIKNEKDK